MKVHAETGGRLKVKFDKITMDHGSGGKLTLELIENVFRATPGLDSAILGDIAFTTDSHSIKPLFFKGGDIGKLSVCGTINDLLCVGAKPMYLSSAFIMEEGFDLDELEKIAQSMRDEAKNANVKIVCGDTKVVEAGKGFYINTSGIGKIIRPIDGSNICENDQIIVTGNIGEHGFSILNERENLNLASNLQSDCAQLTSLILPIIESDLDVHWMRDPTRGGIAMCLNELCYKRDFGVEIFEELVPISEEVSSISEMLGIEPYYSANEGKMVIVANPLDAPKILDILHSNPLGKNANIIGNITKDHPQKVLLNLNYGTKRLLSMPLVEKMPRIC
ncbi:MAG: hydrogenase expression/formation protein HypE [Desulfurella multipotens]|nr:MAG: hydrogenase expression/formation protein HypE [Desulfurella multipotens]